VKDIHVSGRSGKDGRRLSSDKKEILKHEKNFVRAFLADPHDRSFFLGLECSLFMEVSRIKHGPETFFCEKGTGLSGPLFAVVSAVPDWEKSRPQCLFNLSLLHAIVQFFFSSTGPPKCDNLQPSMI
jgi:hypothetical protein